MSEKMLMPLSWGGQQSREKKNRHKIETEFYFKYGTMCTLATLFFLCPFTNDLRNSAKIPLPSAIICLRGSYARQIYRNTGYFFFSFVSLICRTFGRPRLVGLLWKESSNRGNLFVMILFPTVSKSQFQSKQQIMGYSTYLFFLFSHSLSMSCSRAGFGVVSNGNACVIICSRTAMEVEGRSLSRGTLPEWFLSVVSKMKASQFE